MAKKRKKAKARRGERIGSSRRGAYWGDLSEHKERPCRKAAHKMHEKWYTEDAEEGRGTVCHHECAGLPP